MGLGNALNVVFDSDYAGAGGAISVSGNITSNGGNITLGGGSGAITSGSGYAVGDANISNSVWGGKPGIYINNATVNAGAGNIIANGHGADNGSTIVNAGVEIDGTSGKLQTTSGNITVNGIGGAGNGYDEGIIIYGGSGITTATGAISLYGTGGSTGNNNDGIQVNAGGAITSTGFGTINITGVAGPGGIGVEIANGGVTTIGGASDTGNITLNMNTLNFSNLPTIQTTGSVTFAPYTPNTSIGFSGGAGTLQVTQAIMDAVNAPTVTVGSTSAGLLTTGAFTWESTLTNLNLLGGNITMGGNLTNSTVNGATLTLQAAQNITTGSISGSSGHALNLLIDADYAGAGGYAQGNYNIATYGGNITIGGGSGTISAGNGYAVGSSSSGTQYGFYTNYTLNAGGGNIVINGQGGTYAPGSGASSNDGIYWNAGGILTSGSGIITLNGIGGAGGVGASGDYGLYLATNIISGTGAITLNGTGGTAAGWQ